MTETQKLLPCPFCSSIPHIEFSHEAGRWDIYEIECDCGISVYGPCGHEGDEAKSATIRKWNTRSSPSESMVEVLEELCASVEREEELNGSISSTLMSDVRQARAALKLEAIDKEVG